MKQVSTFAGIIIILFAIAILLGGAFAIESYLIKDWESKSVTGLVVGKNIINPIAVSKTILTATPISGVAPLEIMFSGRVIFDSKTTLVLDYGEPQINYCFVGLTGKKGSDMYDINPKYHTYKTAGTYVAKLRKGINCSGPAVCCTPGEVVDSVTINVK